MKFLHLTHSRNLDSILKYGLLPTYIDNDSHWEVFKNYGLKERKCIYLWDAETYNNGKYLKDMVYTKMFIHPRNNFFWERDKTIINKEEEDLYIDFKKFGNKLYGDGGKHVVLEIDSLNINPIGNWLHSQEPGGCTINTTVIMDDYYSHDDKNISISKDIINPLNVKLVETFNVRVYNNEKLGFSLK